MLPGTDWDRQPQAQDKRGRQGHLLNQKGSHHPASSAQGHCQPDSHASPQKPDSVPLTTCGHAAVATGPSSPEELTEGLVVGQRAVVGLREQIVHVIQAPLGHELP